MFRQLLAATIVASAVLLGTAHAAVQGSRFQGTVFGSLDGSVTPVVTDFYDDGSLHESFAGASFPGEYIETGVLFFGRDRFILSQWKLTYDNDPDFQASGFCVFGIITTYSITETKSFNVNNGILFRAGPAQPPPL